MKKLPLLLSLGVTAFFFACGDDSSSTKASPEDIPNEGVQDSTQVPVANPDSTGNGEEMPSDSVPSANPDSTGNGEEMPSDSIPGAEKDMWSSGSWAYKTDSSFCTITADTSFSADYNYTGVKGSVTCSYVRGDDPALELTDSWAHVAYKFNPSPEKLDPKDGICLVYSSQTDLLLRIAPENEADLTRENNYAITLPAAKEVTVLNRKFAGFKQEEGWGKKVTLEQNLAAVTEIRIQSQNVYENSFHIVKIGNYGECGDLTPEDISQSRRDSIAAARDSIKHYNDSLKQAAAEAAEARQNFIADSLQKAWLAELGLKGNYPLYPSVDPYNISEVVIEALDSSFWVGGLNWAVAKTGFGIFEHYFYSFSNKETESFDLHFDINNGGRLFIEIDAKPNVYYGFGFDIVEEVQAKGADVSKYKQINVAYSSTNLPIEVVLVPEQNEALIGDDLYEITQGDNFRFTLPATDGEIKEVTLPFTSFAQKGWGVKQSINDVVKALGAIQFAVNGYTIDFDAVASSSTEVRIYGVGWE